MTSSYLANKHFDRHRTYLKRSEYVYSWTIHSFSEWLVEVDYQPQYSPVFPTDPAAQYRWKLELDPERKLNGVPYISLYLCYEVAPKPVNVKYELSFKNDQGRILRKLSTSGLFGVGYPSGYGWPSFCDRTSLLKCLVNDVLVITCKAEVITGIVTETETTSIQPRNDLGNDMASLMKGEQFGDVTVTVGKRKFLVYKGILAARSSVFTAMFSHDLLENVQNTVTITDIAEEVFEELLWYIYTDKVMNMDRFAYELFAAADKYLILPLKALCEQSILAGLSVSNAARALQLADTHKATEMKARVLQFLASEASYGVTQTLYWRLMSISHPHLLCEAYEAITSRIEPEVKLAVYHS